MTKCVKCLTFTASFAKPHMYCLDCTHMLHIACIFSKDCFYGNYYSVTKLKCVWLQCGDKSTNESDRINISDHIALSVPLGFCTGNVSVKVWRSSRQFYQEETLICMRASSGWVNSIQLRDGSGLTATTAPETGTTQCRAPAWFLCKSRKGPHFIHCLFHCFMQNCLLFLQASEQIYHGNTEGGFYL